MAWPTILPSNASWRPSCSIPKYYGDPSEDPSPLAAQRETCALDLALQSTTAEWAENRLTAALLTLQGGADVPQGLPGQRPKQIPGGDQLASTLTWKGL